MTEPVSGSSLLQARDSHSSHHNHHNHIRSHHNHERLHQRQDQSSETVVQVVQTISVIQIIDASGATVSTTTQTSEPTTIQYSVSAEVTFGIESEPDVTISSDATTSTDVALSSGAASSSGFTTSSVAAVNDDVSGTAASSVSSETASSVDTATSSSISSMPSSYPTVESFAPITTALSSDSSTIAFPTFAGVTNSTTATGSTTNADSTTTAFPTSSLFSNETVSTKSFTANLTTSTLPHSSGTILYNDTYTTTIGLSSGFTSSFASFTGTATSTGTEDNGSVTGFGFGTSTDGSGSGSTATGDSSSPSSTSTDVSGSGSGSSSSSTSAGTVAGSVLGAVAGIGLILIAALMLLRYKKRQRGLRLSDTNGLPGTRGLVLGGGGDGPSGGSPGMGDMSEGRSVPFMVPAALANLTGYKRNSQRTASSEGTERGFHKVSGRKLPSVLQHGGDGYSDPTSAANPRDTMMTDQSFYRDSQGYYTGPDIPRLAVGSPMRPESGVPVFHPGPGRTPVTASAYFGSNLEPPRKDPLGRSLASQDGSRVSRGSGSRFTEEI